MFNVINDLIDVFLCFGGVAGENAHGILEFRVPFPESHQTPLALQGHGGRVVEAGACLVLIAIHRPIIDDLVLRAGQDQDATTSQENKW